MTLFTRITLITTLFLTINMTSANNTCIDDINDSINSEYDFKGNTMWGINPIFVGAAGVVSLIGSPIAGISCLVAGQALSHGLALHGKKQDHKILNLLESAYSPNSSNKTIIHAYQRFQELGYEGTLNEFKADIRSGNEDKSLCSLVKVKAGNGQTYLEHAYNQFGYNEVLKVMYHANKEACE